MELFYFGTDNRSHGHFFWTVKEQYMSNYSLDNKWPFHPEKLAMRDPNRPYSGTGLDKGDVRYFNIGGYSICYIEGSAIDDRGGTKSVWWVKGHVDLLQLKKAILENPASKELIDMMEKKFKINWDYESQTRG